MQSSTPIWAMQLLEGSTSARNRALLPAVRYLNRGGGSGMAPIQERESRRLLPRRADRALTRRGRAEHHLEDDWPVTPEVARSSPVARALVARCHWRAEAIGVSLEGDGWLLSFQRTARH